MFLGQSHHASAYSQERSTEPSLDLLCRSTAHERMDAAGNRVSRDISRDHKRNEEWRARSDTPYRNGVYSAPTGQAVGLTRNQQGSQTCSAVECAVQDFRHTTAPELCGQGRDNSILGSPIRLA